MSLNCCDKRVICLLCGGKVPLETSSTTISPLTKLRSLLEQIQSHNVHSAADSSQNRAQQLWKKLRNYVMVPFLMQQAMQKRSKEDLVQTAVLRHKFSTLSKYFTLWRERAAEKRMASSEDPMPTPMGMLVRSESLQVRTKCPTSFAGRCGLRNLGNTCYMNSAVQVLSNARKLRDYFYYWDLGQKPKQDDTSLSESMRELIKATWGGKMGFYTPDPLLQAVWRNNNAFAGFKQQDVQEFLMFLLNQLSEESKPQSGPSHLQNMLSGSIFSQVKCDVCGTCSRSETEFCGIVDLVIPSVEWVKQHDHLAMPPPPPTTNGTSNTNNSKRATATKKTIAQHAMKGGSRGGRSKATAAPKSPPPKKAPAPPKPCVSLSHCLDYTFKNPEVLSGDNSFRCAKCKKLVSAVKSNGISKLPPQYLILHLSRSQFNMRTLKTSKNQCHVDFPLKELDMSPFVEGKVPGLYDLIGVVVHHGRSMNVGHYTSFGLRTKAEDAAEEVWMRYNDALVQVATETEVLRSEACLLWFECRKTDAN